MAIKNIIIVLLALALAVAVQADKPSTCRQLESSGCCHYKFSAPHIPILRLPAINGFIHSGNPIILNTGSSFPSSYSCLVNNTEYLDDNLNWSDAWIDALGRNRRGINVFQLVDRSIRTNFASNNEHEPLRHFLTGRLVRLRLSCSRGVSGCLQFFVNEGEVVRRKDTCFPPDISGWAPINNPTTDVELKTPVDPVYPHWVSNLPCCLFRFNYPALPVFKIQGVSQKKGDAPLMLNPDNKMVYRWGASVPDTEACQGVYVDYLNQNGKWINSWNDRQGNVRGNITLFYGNFSSFYMANEDLDAATGSQQLTSLSGKLIRMQINCKSYQGCVLFTLNGGHKATTLPSCSNSSAVTLPAPSGGSKCPTPPDSAPINMTPLPPVRAPFAPPPQSSTPAARPPIMPPVNAPTSPPVAPPSSIPNPKPKPDHPTSDSSHGATRCPSYRSYNASRHIIPPPTRFNCSVNVIDFDFTCRAQSIHYLAGLNLRVWASTADGTKRKTVCLRVLAVPRSTVITLSSSATPGRAPSVGSAPWASFSAPSSVYKDGDDDYKENASGDGDESDYDYLEQRYPGVKNRTNCITDESDDRLGVNEKRSTLPTTSQSVLLTRTIVGSTIVDITDEDDEVVIPLDYEKMDILNHPEFHLVIDQCPIESSFERRPGPIRIHSRASDMDYVPRVEIIQSAKVTTTLHYCQSDSDCSNARCIPRDEGETGFCSCNSGWFTPACVLKAPPSCALKWVTPADFAASGPPAMDVSVKFKCAALQIVAQSRLVVGRVSTEITFNHNSSSVCSYPGLLWLKDVNATGCTEQWRSHIPWNIARTCANWIITEDCDWTTWTSYLVIRHKDGFGNRTTEHVVPIQVKFPKMVKCETQINVTAPVDLGAAIFSQIMSYEQVTATFRGDIRFFISLGWPYYVKAWRYASGPPFPVALFVDDSNSPAECTTGQYRVNETFCTQRFRLQVNPTPDTCEITGTYVIRVTLGCRPGTNVRCPFDQPGAQQNATIVMRIVSERFCGASDLDVGISGTLRSFADPNLSTQATLFDPERPAYFRARVISESDLATTKITELWVSRYTAAGVARAPVALWTIMGITDAGRRASFRVISQGYDYVIFSFVPSALMGADMASTITCTASLEVTYFFQSIGSISWKRSVLEFQTASQAEQTFTLATLQLTRPTHSITVRKLPPPAEGTEPPRTVIQQDVTSGAVGWTSVSATVLLLVFSLQILFWVTNATVIV